jgi:hypothetical protein
VTALRGRLLAESRAPHWRFGKLRNVERHPGVGNSKVTVFFWGAGGLFFLWNEFFFLRDASASDAADGSPDGSTYRQQQNDGLSRAPRREHSLSAGRIILDPINGLPAQVRGLGDRQMAAPCDRTIVN